MPYKDLSKRKLLSPEKRRQYNAARKAKVQAAREVGIFLGRQTTSYRRERRYGLTPERFDALTEAQGGLCACCRLKPPTDVDHDHDARFVRGLLCRPCNLGLGMFADDPERLLAAALYLEQASPRHGLFSKEKKAPRSITKATAELAAQIRSDYSNGLGSYPVLARKYGLHAVTIGTIVRGEVWQQNSEIIQ